MDSGPVGLEKKHRKLRNITETTKPWFSATRAFLPGMADEQVAVQTIWMLHQGPTDLARLQRHRLDVLFLVVACLTITLKICD